MNNLQVSTMQPNDFLKSVGLRIAEERKIRKLSQEQLAEKAHVSQRTISGIEQGKNMTIGSLFSILDAMRLGDAIAGLLPTIKKDTVIDRFNAQMISLGKQSEVISATTKNKTSTKSKMKLG